MKKILMLALIAIATGTTAFAGPRTISTKVTEHFSAAFKNAKDVSWNANDRFDKVSFLLGGEKVDAFYDVEGDLIGTMKTVSLEKLPKSALEVITTKYTFPDHQLKDCIEFTNSGNEKNYYVSFEKANETLVLEITHAGRVSVFTRTKK
jgi:hypothetical protein